MDDVTVTEWLQSKQLTASEIDFLLMLILSLTAMHTDATKSGPLFAMLREQFPTYVVEPGVNYNEYGPLHATIQHNIPNKIDTKQLLERMSADGLCKPYCELVLNLIR